MMGSSREVNDNKGRRRLTREEQIKRRRAIEARKKKRRRKKNCGFNYYNLYSFNFWWIILCI